MLNIRVFALVALATFGVAVVLHAVGPSSVARTGALQPVVQQTVLSESVPAQAASAQAAAECASGGAAAPPEPAASRVEASEPSQRSPAPPSRRARSETRRPRSRAVLVRAAAPASGGLQAEQRQLEVVQKALEKGRGAAAARALDEYGAVFPSGELGLEAELLRIDVALARGERERALELARSFQSRPGAKRYEERLAALIGSGPREEPQTSWMGSR